MRRIAAPTRDATKSISRVMPPMLCSSAAIATVWPCCVSVYGRVSHLPVIASSIVAMSVVPSTAPRPMASEMPTAARIGDFAVGCALVVSEDIAVSC